MAKLTREQKIEIYNRKKNGETHSNLSEIYGINRSVIKYLVKLIDLHGSIILRNDSNRYYFPDFKLVSINRVLVNHESVNSVALDIGLSSAGMLRNWIRKYKGNGYNVIEKKQGRPSMTRPKISKNQNLTSEE